MAYKQERNKKNAIEFYTMMVNDKMPQEAMDLYGASYYRQHNPFVEDKKEGFVKHFLRLNVAVPHNEVFVRTIAEDDLVCLHVWHQQFPEHFIGEASQENYLRYGLVSFDMFRFTEEGKICEHWDSMQWMPFPADLNKGGSVEAEPWWPEGKYTRLEESANSNNMLDGETEVKDLDKTQSNKETVRQFVQDVLVDNRYEDFGSYFGDNFVQHISSIPDGVSEFKKSLMTLKDDQGLSYRQFHKAVAEGNFVYTQSQGIYRGRVTSISDLYRLENDRIVETWQCVFESVPDSAAHSNTLF